MLMRFLHDLRFAFRALRRAPGFLLIAVSTLAVGMAATIAIFSVVSAVLLRPLNYPDAERLVHFEGREDARYGLSMPDALDIQSRARTVEAVALYQGWSYVAQTSDGLRTRRAAASVSSNYFPLLGVRPIIGRFFTADEDRPGHAPAIVIGEALWRSDYGARSDAIGRTLSVDGESYTIVGVAPAGVMDPVTRALRWNPPEAWRVHPQAFTDGAADRGWIGFWAFGRLRAGVSVAAAQAEVNAILRDAYPHLPARQPILQVSTFHNSLVRAIRPTLIALLAAVGGVLLIGCANVANLLLGRVTIRGAELVVRASLGASRGRLILQLCTESLVLSVAAAGLGLALGAAALRVLGVMLADHLPPGVPLAPDWRVAGFAVLLALVTALLFGLAPALQLTRDRAMASLRESGRGQTGGRGASVLRHSLVVAETALAVLLLAGAGLLFRTFWNLQSIQPGFDAQSVTAAPLYLLSEVFPTHEQQTLALAGVQRELSRQSMVETVAAISDIPMSGAINSTGVTKPGTTESISTLVRTIAGDYFGALRVPLLRGRAFEPADGMNALPVAIINETAARRHFGALDPLGRTLEVRGVERTIVGMVKDVQEFTLSGDLRPVLYTPYAQETQAWMRSPIHILVRARASTERAGTAIRDAARAVGTGIGTVRPLQSYIESDVSAPRFRATLVMLFAALALALAGVGLGSVIAYGVTQRRPELGVRLALGADPHGIAGLVIRQSVRLAGAGVLLGAIGALAVSRLIARFLYGVPPTDPVTLAAAAAALLAVALVASWAPALRAARTDPARTLRGE